MRGLTLKLVAVLVLVAGAYLTYTSNSQASGDCSNNSVVKCGVYNYGTLKQKYNENYKGTQAIYQMQGISSDMVNSGVNVSNGYVTKNNTVELNGKVVAKNAMSVGRQYMPGSQKVNAGGTTMYLRAPSTSFNSTKLEAYVYTDKYGKFLGAVIKDCGNPVKGTPVYEPKKVEVCDMQTAQVVSVTEEEYDNNQARYTKNVSECDRSEYCDLVTNQMVSIAKYEYDASRHVAKEKCNEVQVCDTQTGEVVTVKEKDLTDRYIKDVSECEEVQVCDKTAMQVVTVKKYQSTDTKYTTNLEECDKKVEVCDTQTGEVVTVKEKDLTDRYTTNKADCDDMQVCDLSSKTVVTVNNYEYDEAKHSKDTSDCDSVEVCDLTTKSLKTVKKLDLNENLTTDVEKCKVEVCDTETNNVVSVYSENITSTQTTDLSQCDSVQVCDLTSKEVVTVAKNDATSENYSNNLDDCKENCTVDGKEGLKADDPNCKEVYCEVEGLKDLTANDPNCKEKEEPKTTVELPKTGVTGTLLNLVGLGTLAGASLYYAMSRKNV